MGALVKIKTFINRMEAGQAKGLLDEKGINSVIKADDVGGFRPDFTLTGKKVTLLVAQEDVKKAKEIIEVLEKEVDSEKDIEIEIIKLQKNVKGMKSLPILIAIFGLLGIFTIKTSFHLIGESKIALISLGIILILFAFALCFTYKGALQAKEKLDKIKKEILTKQST